MDPDFEYQFTALRKTHNQGVFDVYSPDMLRCRKSGVLTRATGRLWPRTDHRRLPPRGAVRHSATWSANVSCSLPTCSRPLERGEALEATLRLREELAEQRRALLQMQEMAARYGCDISHPARTAREAVQWLYFAYGGGEVAERRRHVAGAHGYLPRHLYRTRSARRFIE